MSKTISSTNLTGTLSLTLCNDGYWLWDETRGMNLAVRAKTSENAFVEALTYYQERLARVESAHKKLKEQVDVFVAQFADEEED